MKNITLKVGGMSCSACSNSLEKFLKKQEGIIDASVNLVLACAEISYDDKLTINDLNTFIKKAGFIPEGIYRIQDDERSFKNKFIFLMIYLGLSIIFLYLSMGHMINLPIPKILDIDANPKIFGITLLILTLPYIIYGFDIFKSGIKNIFYLSPNMDTLVTIGFIASFVYSTINLSLLLTNKTGTANNLFYDSCAIVIFFVKLGRFIDLKAKQKTKDAVKGLVQITPKYAKLKKDQEITEVTIDEIHENDILVAAAGDKIAVDGFVVNGKCYVDESFITGESMPVKKESSNNVIAGSIVTDGMIEYSATRIGKDSTISEIVHLVVDATNSKAKIARIADVVSLFFVPTIISIAILTTIIYLIIGKEFNYCMNIFVSILVVACPCALGLATPLAIVISEGVLAKKGILVKKSTTLEKAAKIDTIIFDKTGTLTNGKLIISDKYEYSNIEYMSYVCSLEQLTNHPISTAFKQYAKEFNTNLFDVTNFNSIDGAGISGVINNKEIFVGNSRIIDMCGLTNAHKNDEDELKKKGCTIVYVVIDKSVCALIGIKDNIRQNVKETIQILQKNHHVIMLTGDNEETAKIIAIELMINDYQSNVLPKDKIDLVNKLIKENHQVMMVGDGINDAPALASATIGVSISGGTDIANDASDVILMNDNISSITNLIMISKKTILNIKENLFWAFFYNILMIPIAMGLFTKWDITINPMIAGAGMTLSSLCVIINALRLFKYRKENKNV